MAHGAPDHRLVIDLVELVKLINKIEEITKVAEITSLKNLESLDLVDRITRIDAIDSLGEISLGKIVPLVSPPLLLYDDFDSGVLKWTPEGDGRLEPSNVRAFSGSGSMRIYTGPSVEKYEIAKRMLAPSADLTMRFVCRFSLSSGLADFYITFGRYTGAEYMSGEVRYLTAEKKWQYLKGGGGYVDIPDGAQNLKIDLDVWHRLTLGVDFSTRKYVKLEVDALTMDMSELDVYAISDTVTPEHTLVSIKASANADAITEAYIDDVYTEAW